MRRGFAMFSLLCAWPCNAAPAQSVAAGKVRLHAVVVDSVGRPLAGVKMIVGKAGKLSTAAALEKPAATSDEKGRIECRLPSNPVSGQFGYPGVQRYALFAKPGYSAVRCPTVMNVYYNMWGMQSGAGSNRDLGRIVMHPAGVLTGVVRGARGRPLAGVRVEASDLSFSGNARYYGGYGNNQHVYLSAGYTDARGQFKLPGVFVDGCSLEVTAPGHYRQTLPFVSSDPGIDVALEPSGYISGKIVDGDGKSIDAFLYLTFEGGVHNYRMNMNPPRTGEDGTFKLSILDRGRYMIRANAVIKPGETYRSAVSQVLAAPKVDIKIVLGAAAVANSPITVKVVAKGSKKPVSKARAVVLWQDPRHVNALAMESVFASGAKTLKDGKVELPAPVGSQAQKGTMLVKAEGFAPRIVKGIEYDSEKPPTVEVAMIEASVIEGIVVDEVGSVLADAEVTVSREGSNSPPGFGGMPRANVGTTVRTDSKGRFRVGDLAGGRHEIVAWVGGRPTSKIVRVKLSGGERRQDLRVLVSNGVSLSGKIVLGTTEDGKQRIGELGGKGYRVRLSPTSKATAAYGRMSFGLFSSGSYSSGAKTGGRSTERTSELGADGEFKFDGLAVGRYRFFLLAPPIGKRGSALATVIEPVRVRSRPMQRDFDISEDLGGVVRGKLNLPGSKIAMSRLYVLSQPASSAAVRSRRLAFNKTWFRCIVEPDGSFAFRIGKGKHLVWIMDAVNAIVLYRHENPIEVETGEDFQMAVEVPLTLLRIRLRPEKPTAGFMASSLNWIVTHPGVAEDPNFYNNYRGWGRGIEGREQFLLVVPTVRMQFAVWSLITAVDFNGGHGNGAIGEGEILPVLGRLNTLDIKVAPPPEASEPIGK